MSVNDNRRQRATGGCLCGSVRYEVHGPLRDVINCHCSHCRRTHGHFAAYSAARRDDLVLIERRGLKWFSSSDPSVQARRGFCKECGASLFWEPSGKASISIAAGTIDPPSGLKTIGHIYVGDASDYYEITDDLKKWPASSMDSG